MRIALFVLGVAAVAVSVVLVGMDLSDPGDMTVAFVLMALGMLLLVTAELGIRDVVARQDAVTALLLQVLLLAVSVAFLLTIEPAGELARVATWAHAGSLFMVAMIRAHVRRREVELSQWLASRAFVLGAVGVVSLVAITAA